ncbi:hypothetical protein ABSDF3334 [Acinetobacter baumannii SDF]|uniref:Uncharacterized protein n=1 Tax=Acinetobacter baumannii (strain SDF) TaxID=509170 RepID=B0VMI9_ACIBS|nr:hypothetical protein ABSDF3334 [Acinetobacter baumannii SDF]
MIKRCISWHLIYRNKQDLSKSIPRAVAIIQVRINHSKTVYLLEMEKKTDSEAHCLLIIRNQYYGVIEDHIIKSLLRSTARKNHWALSFNNLYFHKMEHRHKSISDFANNIIDAVKNI